MAAKSMTFKLFGKDVSASKTFKDVGKTAAGVAGGIGASFAASKLTDFAKQSIGAMDNLGKQTLTLQRYMGGSTEDASRLAHAFTMTGTNTEDAARGLGIFSKNLIAAKDQQRAFKSDSEEAAAAHKKFTGHLGKNAQAFADYGIRIRDANGDMLPMKDLLASTADVFSKMPAGPTRTAAAMKLFGKSGASLLPFLSKGAAGVNELMQESDKLGTTLSGKDTDAVKKNTAEKRRMGEAIKGIQVSIGRYLMPAISALVTFMSEKVIPVVAKVVGWLKDNKDIVVVLAGVLVPIIAGFKAWTIVMGIFNAVMAVNPIVLIILAIVGLVALLVVAYKKFDWFRKFVDGAWQGIQKVIRAVVDWFMTNAWPIIKRIIGFMVAYYKLLWKVISAVFSWIWKVVSAYITFFRERVWPIIRWVIDKIAAYYRWLWGTVSVVFRLIWVVIQGFVAFFRDRVWPIIRWVIDKVAAYYRWLWSVISTVFRLSWQIIQGFIGFFRDKVWPVIRWVIDKVKLGFQVMWSTVAGVWNAVWAKVAWVRDKLYTAAMAIKGFFTGIWDGIKDAAQAAFDWVRDIWNRTLGGKGFHIPGTSVDFKIPMLAAGGIVTRPTLALVGEAGPEAVIPLRRNAGLADNTGGGDVHIHVHGSYAGSKEQLARTVVDALNEAQNRGLRLNLRAS